jgi:hypothetical protein
LLVSIVQPLPATCRSLAGKIFEPMKQVLS